MRSPRPTAGMGMDLLLREWIKVGLLVRERGKKGERKDWRPSL